MALSLGGHSKGTNVSVSSVATGSVTTTGGSGTVFSFFIEWYGSLSAPTLVDDNKGNTFTQVGSSLTNNSDPSFFSALYECVNGTGGSSHVVTATFGETKASVSCFFHEIKGTATSSPRDQAPAGVNDGSSPYTSSSATTTQADEFLMAYTATLSSSGTEALTWGNSFVSTGESFTDADNNATGGCASRIVSSTGTYNSTVTSSGAGTSSTMCWIVTYKSAPTGVLYTARGTLPFID